MNDDRIARLLILASQLIICPPTFVATGLILEARFTLPYWLAMGITTAISCLIADKVYTSMINPFAWLIAFWHNFTCGLALLFDNLCQTALQQTYTDLQQEIAKLGIEGEHSPEPLYSDDFHHMAEALRIMAAAGRISLFAQHQEIEPYTPPDDETRQLIDVLTTQVHGSQQAMLDRLNRGRFYPLPEPLLRYEIVMHDDWQSGDTSDMPLQVNEKAVTSFLCDETVDY